jgi:hypothetical protein
MLIYIEYLLLSVCVGITLLAAVSGVLELKNNLAAQKNFLSLLTTDPASVKLLALRERMVDRGVIDVAELQQLTVSLERIARALPEKQRLSIERALFQESVHARARYAEMLLDKAGIGLGFPPIAVR